MKLPLLTKQILMYFQGLTLGMETILFLLCYHNHIHTDDKNKWGLGSPNCHS